MANKKIKKLTAAQKRVAIAEDVLLRISRGTYEIRSGYFVDMPQLDSSIEVDRAFLEQDNPECNVCAVGAAIVSAIRLFNSASFNDGVEVRESFRIGKKFFHPKQLVLIENAFERWNGAYVMNQTSLAVTELVKSIPDYELNRAIAFGESYSDTTERAVKIFENIVENKGVFKP
jgi:hypothetical protein